MDENWPLFAARFSRRAPTENEARLLEASRRLWPAALRVATNQVAETPGLAFDPKSITTECWEKALLSTLGTMDKLGAVHISELDSYLFAIFGYRLNRYLARERKRSQIIQSVSTSNATDTSWVERIESGIALQEAMAMADEWFRAMAWCYCHDFSWEEIGTLFEVTKEQARKRFEYGIQKLRKLLLKPAQEESEPE
jgi:DNA-directed RNA polymerase specialized sigma24 family protein